ASASNFCIRGSDDGAIALGAGVAAGGAAAVTEGAVCDAGGAVLVAFAVPPLVGGRTVGVDTAVLLTGAMAGGAGVGRGCGCRWRRREESARQSGWRLDGPSVVPPPKPCGPGADD